MRLSIVHETRYRYTTPANYTIQYLRLSPQTTLQQKVLDWHLDLPVPARPFVDGFGNTAHVLVIDKPHQEIRICAQGRVEVDDGPVALVEHGLHRAELYMRNTELTAPDESLGRFADAFRKGMADDRVATVDTLMLAVREKLDYQVGVTNARTTAAQAFARGAGVCQDHAHVFIACCRRLHVPARYVSGYLAPKSRKGMGELASHAWAEVWVEGQGWQGVDVANRVRAQGRHVRVAVGLDYLDACPVRGFHRGGTSESLGVEVRVNEAVTRDQSYGEEPPPGAPQAQQEQQQQQQ